MPKFMLMKNYNLLSTVRLCERSEAIQRLAKGVLFLVLLAGYAIVFSFSSAFAASYSVTPLVIDKELEKRESITEIITLTNTSDQLIRIFPTVNEVSVEEGGKVQTFLEPSMIADRAHSITSWIEIGRGRIELKPQEKKEITLTIRVNPEVTAGEYHAFIGFPEGANRPEAEKVVYTGSAPGTVVRIGVDKVQNEFLRLTGFKTERFVKSSAEGEILISLANPGDSPVIPEGEVIFYDKRGTEVGAIPINEQKIQLEPGKDARLALFIPNTLTVGKYKAFLSLEYGQKIKTSINDTAFFYVLPLKQILILFAIITLVTMVIAFLVHRRFKGEKYDESVSEVGLYIRSTKSEPKDHDIDLSKKNEKPE